MPRIVWSESPVPQGSRSFASLGGRHFFCCCCRSGNISEHTPVQRGTSYSSDCTQSRDGHHQHRFHGQIKPSLISTKLNLHHIPIKADSPYSGRNWTARSWFGACPVCIRVPSLSGAAGCETHTLLPFRYEYCLIQMSRRVTWLFAERAKSRVESIVPATTHISCRSVCLFVCLFGEIKPE